MPTVKGLETARILVHCYETLAMEYNRVAKQREFGPKSLLSEPLAGAEPKPNPPSAENYYNGFGLLIINTSIIEGTLRSILSSQLGDDIDKATTEGLSRGQTAPLKEDRLLEKFRAEVEIQGGWEKLKEQFTTYLGVNVDSLMGDPLKEAIHSLFVLRNVLAHGTALIHPKDRLADTMKDIYPYVWQSKLQRATVYLQSVFGKGDIFDNLACYEVPEHFWIKTKELFEKVQKNFSLPERVSKTIELVAKYQFGFRL